MGNWHACAKSSESCTHAKMSLELTFSDPRKEALVSKRKKMIFDCSPVIIVDDNVIDSVLSCDVELQTQSKILEVRQRQVAHREEGI